MSLKLHNQSFVQTTVATGYHSSADGVFDYDNTFRQIVEFMATGHKFAATL
jgi:hypothetical protein